MRVIALLGTIRTLSFSWMTILTVADRPSFRFIDGNRLPAPPDVATGGAPEKVRVPEGTGVPVEGVASGVV